MMIFLSSAMALGLSGLVGWRRWLLLGRGFLHCRAFTTSLIVCNGSADEPGKKRLRRRWLRFELRMILERQKQGKIRQFDYFHQRVVRAGTGKSHAVRRELIAIAVVELVTMTMSLRDFCFPVASGRNASRFQLCRLRTQPHGAAL